MEVPPPPGCLAYKYQWLTKISKIGNVKEGKCCRPISVGRIRLKLIVRDFSDLQQWEIVCRKSLSVVTYLKQIVHKASKLLF